MLLMLIALAHALPTENASYTADTTPWGAVDLTGIGTTFATYGDDTDEDITLPFAFPFFGASYTTATLGYNGGITFDGGGISADNTTYWNFNGPDISCWWDDLYATRALTWWSDTANDRVVFSWDNALHYNAQSASTISFQMMLYANGAIECHYTDTSFANSTYDMAKTATIGIGNTSVWTYTTDDVLQLSSDSVPSWMADHTAVRFSACEDADGDGFSCYDCDDAVFHATDADGDLHPDACDSCPGASSAMAIHQSTTGDCTPGFGEITLFAGTGWTSSCATFSVGDWSMAQMISAGIPNDAASSMLVGPLTTVTLYNNSFYGGLATSVVDDDDDIFALGLSSFKVSVSSASSTDGCTPSDPLCTDDDGDGFCAESWDCDDTDAMTNPLGADLCGEPDHDCDGTAPADNDDDGFCADDCDDLDASTNPGAAEVCDGLDHDCDGVSSAQGDVDADAVCNPDDATWDGWTTTTVEGATSDGSSLVITDANLDGDLDLFATYNTRRVIGLLSNDGTGTFGSSQNRSVSGAKLFDLGAGDIDGDGDPDAIVSGEAGVLLGWVRNSGSSFASATMSVATVTERPRAVKLADLDGDGDNDAIVGFNGAGVVRTWLNDGTGVFTAQSTLALVGADRLAVGDFDADGAVDIAGLASAGTATVWFNDGGGAYTALALSGSAGGSEIVTADLDGDGVDDLADCGAAGVVTWRSQGDRTFATAVQASTARAMDLSAADLDDDGDVDLVTSWTNLTQVGVLLNAGDGTFPYAATLLQLGADAAQDIDAGDLDGDGDADLAIQVPGDTDRLYTVKNPLYVDADHDGSISTVDCNESDAAIYPGAAEACDGVDNDCSGLADDGATDTDADGTCDLLDLCPLDLIGDVDGDGLCDSDDPCPYEVLNDSDGDGSCDSVDLCAGDDTTGDADGDRLCTDLDACPLDPYGDSDGDGSCDSVDLCVGDDTTGDSDADGECDDTDFVLSAGTVSAGATLTLTSLHASPGARVYFLLGTSGTGAGPCYPGSTICTDLRSPTVLGSTTADAQGRARVTLTVPATVPAGRTVRFQSAWVRSAGGLVSGEVSNVVVAVSR